jgi:hypothetical protein
MLTTVNAAGTNGLTSIPKHRGAGDNKFLITHVMTDQRCLTTAIARRSALTARPSSSSFTTEYNLHHGLLKEEQINYETSDLEQVIIIISPLQSTAGHRPLQSLTASLDLRLLKSSSCQPSRVNRHSTWPGGVLHYVYLDAVSTPEPRADIRRQFSRHDRNDVRN